MNVFKTKGDTGKTVLTHSSWAHAVWVHPDGKLQFFVAGRECFARSSHVKMLESHNLEHLYYGKREMVRRAEFHKAVKI